MKFGKVWGHVTELFKKNNVKIMRIEGVKGHKSSVHIHNHNKSMFYVESGVIKISVKKNDYDLTDITILNKGESTIISNGEYHNFEVVEDAIAYEFYWVELDENDIVRINCGS